MFFFFFENKEPMYRVWHSSEGFADYIIAKTCLKNKNVVKAKMYESDTSKPKNFHTMPDHIKQILYLDAPDIIVEYNSEPIFSIEESKEAGTGHNAFQRFARLAASVENNVPALYLYPEAAIISRKGESTRWDSINPLVMKGLNSIMNIYGIPALLFYYPTDYRSCPDAKKSKLIGRKGIKYDKNIDFMDCPDSTDAQMQKLFRVIDDIIHSVEKNGVIKAREGLLGLRSIQEQRQFMEKEFVLKEGNDGMSPLTATVIVPTDYLLNHLSQYEDDTYKIGELLRSRNETVLYQVNAGFRGDPYPGALAAIDYLRCREGKTFEERKYNLVLCWGNVDVDNENEIINISSNKCSVNDFVADVQTCGDKNLLTKDYNELRVFEIPRYYMQVRYGSMFSKSKHIRVYSYFADAILFKDGALWRDA